MHQGGYFSFQIIHLRKMSGAAGTFAFFLGSSLTNVALRWHRVSPNIPGSSEHRLLGGGLVGKRVKLFGSR